MKKIKAILDDLVDAASRLKNLLIPAMGATALVAVLAVEAQAQTVYLPVTGYSLSNTVTIPAATYTGSNTPSGNTNIGASGLSRQFNVKARSAVGIFTSIFLSATNASTYGAASNLPPSMTLSLQPYFDLFGTNTASGATNWTWSFLTPTNGGAFTNFQMFPLGANDGIKGLQFFSAQSQSASAPYISNQVFYIIEPNP